MDTLYGTLLHASTLIRNFIERNVPLPAKLIASKIRSHRRDLSNINRNRRNGIPSRIFICRFGTINDMHKILKLKYA